MKYLWIVLALLVELVKSQNIVLHGRVIDQEGNKLLGATIILYKQGDTVLFKATSTNSKGEFLVAGLPKNHYALLVSSLGFKSCQIKDVEILVNLELAPIILSPETQYLSTVQVSAKKPLVEILPDKTIFNIQGSLNSSGLSAFEVLRKAPGILIDNQNNLIVEGKKGVGIFIGGKESILSGDDLANYLKSLQASDLEAIEIISQPSSKYEAAGTAGIVNLKLKKNMNFGANGTMSLGYALGIYSKYNASLSVNYRNKSLLIFSSYSQSFGKNYSYIYLDRFQSGLEYNQASNNLGNDRNYNLRFGLDYTLNKKSLISFLTSGNLLSNQNTNTSLTPITNLSSGKTMETLEAYGYTQYQNHNFESNLHYRLRTDSLAELTVDGDFGYYTSDRNSLQPNYYLDSSSRNITRENTFYQVSPISIDLYSLKSDYIFSFKKIKVSTGFKISKVKTGNIFNFYDVNQGLNVFNHNRSNIFDYDEQIRAVYLNLNQNGKYWSFQFGLRAEQTLSEGVLTSNQQNTNSDVKRMYLDLFPSGGLTYQWNSKNRAAIQFSSRIDRPDYRSLNPFVYNIDELSFSKGNPFLRPQYTESVKLSNTYNYTLTTSISFSSIRDFIAQITDTLGNNQNFISPQNIANEKIINLGISYPFTMNKWWTGYASLNGYRGIYQSTSPKFFPVNLNTLSFYGENAFSLPDQYSLELSGWYSSPSVWAGTYNTRSLASLDLALQKTWFKNALSLRISISDILKTSNWTGTTQYGSLFIRGSGGYESRQVRINLHYSFGRKTIKDQESRKTGADEEKSRIKP